MAAIQMYHFWTLTDSFASSTNTVFWIVSVCSCGSIFPLLPPEWLVIIKHSNPHWNKGKLGNFLPWVWFLKCISLLTAVLCSSDAFPLHPPFHVRCSLQLGWCCSLFHFSSHWKWLRDTPSPGPQLCEWPGLFTFAQRRSAVRKQEWPEVRWFPCPSVSLCSSWMSWAWIWLCLSMRLVMLMTFFMPQTSHYRSLHTLISELVMFPVWNRKACGRI